MVLEHCRHRRLLPVLREVAVLALHYCLIRCEPDFPARTGRLSRDAKARLALRSKQVRLVWQVLHPRMPLRVLSAYRLLGQTEKFRPPVC